VKVTRASADLISTERGEWEAALSSKLRSRPSGGFVQDPGLPVCAHLQVVVAVQPDEDPGELPADLIKPGQEIPLRLEVLAGGSGRDLLRQDINQPVGLRQKILYAISLVHSETNLGNLRINKNCRDGLLTG